MMCDLCSATGKPDTFHLHTTVTDPDELRPIDRETRLGGVQDPTHAEWVYTQDFFSRLALRYRENPDWNLCPSCHALVTGEGASAKAVMRRYHERNQFLTDDAALAKLITRIDQEIVLGLLYFWYWRRPAREDS